MESNRQARENHSSSTILLTPDVIMNLLRLQRHDRADIENDEEDGETYLLGFSDVEASSGGGLTGNPADCNIS